MRKQVSKLREGNSGSPEENDQAKQAVKKKSPEASALKSKNREK